MTPKQIADVVFDSMQKYCDPAFKAIKVRLDTLSAANKELIRQNARLVAELRELRERQDA